MGSRARGVVLAVFAILALGAPGAGHGAQDVTAAVAVSRRAPSYDFSQLYGYARPGRPAYDFGRQETYGEVVITNSGRRGLAYPLRLVWRAVTAFGVTLARPDEETEAGEPVLLAWPSAGAPDPVRLAPGESAAPVRFAFWNPRRLRFGFDLGVLAEPAPNEAPRPSYVGPLAVAEGELFEASILGIDPNRGDVVSVVAGPLPTGATLVDGVFSWSPDFTQAGSYSLLFTASDGELETAETVAIEVLDVNRPPVLEAVADQAVAEGETLSFGVAATDPDGPAPTVTASRLPTAAIFEDATFRWTPGFDQAGSYSVTFTATDGELTARRTVTIAVADVNRPPALGAVADQAVAEGEALSFGVTATDPDGSAPTVTAAGLPAGAGFDGATFQWTPGVGQAGRYGVTFTASDGALTASVTVIIAVAPRVENRAPVLDAIPDQNVAEGGSFSFSVAAADPDGPVPTVTAAGLPAGAGFDGTTFRWTPGFEQAGSYSVTFTATDGALTAARTVTIAVAEVNRPPVLGLASLPTAQVGQAYYAQQVTASDQDRDPLEFALVQGPAGMTLDPVSGALAWRPGIGDVGQHPVEIRVSDGRGGTDSRSFTILVPDSIPPTVFLTAPREAIPGASFTVRVEAVDASGVASVALEVEGQGRTEGPGSSLERAVTLPEVATVGSSVTVTAQALDAAGNRGQATARVAVVAAPDVTAPAVTLVAPAEVNPGQRLQLSASATDAGGVFSVAFTVNGVPVLGATPARPVVETTVPSDAVPGSVLALAVAATDFAGNTGVARAEATVVAGQDATPPTVAPTAPLFVEQGQSLPLTLGVADAAGVAWVEVYVDHILVAIYPSAPAGPVEVPLPPSAQGPLEAPLPVLVEVRAADFSGNQTTQTRFVELAPPARGLVAGEVYNAVTGLPVVGAMATFRRGGVETSAATDERGRYLLSAETGTGGLTVAAPGMAPVQRPAVAVRAGAVTEVQDAWLAPASGPGAPVPSVLGGTVATAHASLAVPPGALVSDRAFALTAAPVQALGGPLPLGWSPVAVVDVAPHGVVFGSPATLAVPNPRGFGAGSVLVAAVWDGAVGAWVAEGDAVPSADGARLAAAVRRTGQHAFLLPDRSPQVPTRPLAGEPVPGVSPAAVPDAAVATLSPEPRILFYQPGARSEVGLRLDAPVPLPSGTVARVRVGEDYAFSSGSRLAPEPRVQDVTVYGFGAAAGLTAAWPVGPSQVFEPLALERGTISLDALGPEGAETWAVAGPEGMTARAATGEALAIPAGTAARLTPVALRGLPASGVPLALPPGFAYLGGAEVSLGGRLLSASASLSVAAPAAGPALLVRLAAVDGATRLALVGVGRPEDGRVVSSADLLGDGRVRLPGIVEGGRYLFLQAAEPLGFVAGRVYGPGGAALAGALVTAEGTPLVALSQGDGAYAAAVPAGAFAVAALDPVRRDAGTASGRVGAGELAWTDLSTSVLPLGVVSVSPADGAGNVALSAAVTLRFSKPLDPASVTADRVVLTGPAGTVPGSLAVSAGGAVVTLRPSAALAANQAYTVTVVGLADQAGATLAGPFTSRFTSLDTTPPPMPPAGSIAATIPGANGRTTVTATQGSAGTHDTVRVVNATRDTWVPALVNADGSFEARIAAGLRDRVQVEITDPAGNRTVVPLTRFENPDGTVSVPPEGGRLTAAGGLALDIPEGAFPEGATVRFTALTDAELGIPALPSFPLVRAFELSASEVPARYLNVSAPLPAGAGPDDNGVVARVVEVLGGRALSVVDTAKVVGDRFVTSSPPCPGILEKFGRYAMFLNRDEQMRLGMAILKATVPRTRTDVFQAYGEGTTLGAVGTPLFALSPALYTPLSFDVIHNPASELMVALGRSGDAAGVLGAAATQDACLPVPADKPLRVVIRDPVTGAVTRAAAHTSPGSGGVLDLSSLFADPADRTAPAAVWVSWSPDAPHTLDFGKDLVVAFSEPVTLTGARPVVVTESSSGRPVPGQAFLVNRNRAVWFRPDGGLAMGKTFAVSMPGVLDVVGNAFVDPPGGPLTFTVFAPRLLTPTASSVFGKTRLASDLGISREGIVGGGFKDLDFVTTSPADSADGRWHTEIAATREGLGIGYRLFTLDASDPVNPRTVGGLQTGSKFYFRLGLLDDLELAPRSGYAASGGSDAGVERWRARELHVVDADPSVRLCADPGAAEVAAWRARHCLSTPCSVRTGGCGDLLVASAWDSWYSMLRLYDVTDRANPVWIGQRLLSDNGPQFGAQRKSHTPGGLGFPKGFALVPRMDITHERENRSRTHFGTVGAYVAETGIGVELADLGLAIPDILDAERQGGSAPFGSRLEHLERLGLSANLYYTDVKTLRGRLAVIAGDQTDGTGIQTLEVLNPDLSSVGLLFLPTIPYRMAVAPGLLTYDGDGDGTPEFHDYALVTSLQGGLAVAEVSTAGNPALVGLFRTPRGTATRHVEVDQGARIAFVGARWADPSGSAREGILFVDLSHPLGPSVDADGDGWDDRILGRLAVTGTPEVPVGTVEGFRYDARRRLLYAAVTGSRPGPSGGEDVALAVVKMCECPELSADATLRSGTVSFGATTSVFPAEEGGTDAILYLGNDPSNGGTVYADLDVAMTSGAGLAYQIREVPLSGDPADAVLDLTGGRDQGAVGASTVRIPMDVRPSADAPAGSLAQIDLRDGNGLFVRRLNLLLTAANLTASDTRVTTRIDRINKLVTRYAGHLTLHLTHDAEVTVRVDGRVLQTPNGAATVAVDRRAMPAGVNRVLVTSDQVSLPGEHDVEIEAVFRRSPDVLGRWSGKIVHDVVIDESLPVGRSFVEGVDLFDGHLALDREDLAIPGKGVPLRFARVYSSTGARSSGPMGAGWTHSYESRVVVDPAGTVAVLGGEGGGARFFDPVSTTDGAGNPIRRFRPQAGYHGALVFNVRDSTYDYFTKARIRYHYAQSADPQRYEEYVLRFVEDPHGNRTTLAYAGVAPFALSSVTDAGGRTLAFSYGRFGVVPEERIVRIEGPLGLAVTFDYDAKGNLLRASRAGRVEGYAYTSGFSRDPHNLVRVTDPDGVVTEYAWYAEADPFPGETPSSPWGTDRLSFPEKHEFVRSVTRGAGTADASATSFAYDYSGLATRAVTTVVDGRGVTTTSVLHPRGCVVESRVATAGGDAVTRTRWAFEDGIDDVYPVRQTDANGRVTRLTHDANGNLTAETVELAGSPYAAVTDAAGRAVSSVATAYVYDPTFNRPTRKTDPEGRVTLYGLDPATGDLLSVTTDPADGSGPVVLRYSYRPDGLPETATDALGGVTRYARYDSFGNPLEVVDPLGNVVTNTYDDRSRLLEAVDSAGRRSTYAYDALDRLTEVVRFAGVQPAEPALASADEVRRTAWTPAGRKASAFDGLGHTTTYGYDGQGRTASVREDLLDADGGAVVVETLFAYDGAGNRVSETDGRGVRRRFAYDELGRLISTEVEHAGAPGGWLAVSVVARDLAGTVLSETDLHGHATRYDLDGLYRRVGTRLPLAPYGTEARYDRVGNLLATTDANGRGTTYSYDGLNRLVARTDPAGRVTAYGYDAAGNRVREEDRTSGLTVEYGPFDSLGRPAAVTQRFTDPLTGAPASDRTTYAYDDAAHTVTTVTARGVTVTDRRNGRDQVIEHVVDPGRLNLRTIYGYDANGNLTAVMDPQGGDLDLVNVWDGLGRKVKSRYPLGAEERAYYDGNGNLVRAVDPRGISVRHAYDPLNRRVADYLTETVSGGGAELLLRRIAYDDATGAVTEWDAVGNATVREHDALDREVSVTDALGGGLRREWDGVNRTADVDRLGRRTEYRFDGIDRLVETRELDEAGVLRTTVATEYRDADNTRVDRDRRGVETVTRFDPLGRVRRVSKRAPDLRIPYGAEELTLQETEYDAGGNPVRLLDALGNVTEHRYDAASRRVATVEAAGAADEATTAFTYDGAGNLLTVKDGRAHGGAFDERHGYDARYRRVETENGEGGVRRYAYDPAGNLLSATDPFDRVTEYAYDEMGKLVAVDETRGGAGGVTRYVYDARRNRVAQQDPEGNLVTFRYDALGRLTDTFQHRAPGTMAGPDRLAAWGGDEATAIRQRFGYDAEGNQTLFADARGQTTRLTYDYRNRPTGKTYEPPPAGEVTRPTPLAVAYAYDEEGNPLRIEETKRFPGEAAPVAEVTTFAYDPLHRLVRRVNPDGKVLAYAYNPQGNRTELADADGERTAYAYDARHRLASVTVAGAQTRFAYWPDSLERAVIRPNGVRSETSYDRADRPVEVRHHAGDPADPLSLFELRYDRADNRASLTETRRGEAPAATAYEYDALDRLAAVTYPGDRRLAYTLARNGNRLAEAGTDPLGSAVDRRYAYDRLNELLSVEDRVDPSASVAYEYDANGNPSARRVGVLVGGAVASPSEVATYGYDPRDQLTELARTGQPTLTFDHDYAGLRVKKGAGGSEIRYLYDQATVLQEYRAADGAAERTYGYGDGLLSVAEGTAAGRRRFYTLDPQGSVAELTDAAGAAEASYRYDAWGGLTARSGGPPSPRAFGGHPLDDETGLYAMGVRAYDPALGRFLTQDPVWGDPLRPASQHRYLYALGNPLSYVDPTGFEAEPSLPSQLWEWSKGVAKGVVKGVGALPAALIKEGVLGLADIAGAGLGYLTISMADGRNVDEVGALLTPESYMGRLSAEKGTAAAITETAQKIGTGVVEGVITLPKRLKAAALSGDPEKAGEAGVEVVQALWGAKAPAEALTKKTSDLVKGVGKEVLPMTGATAREQLMIRAFAKRQGLEIGIRAADPATAYGTRLLSDLGLPSKPMAVKTKSTFGLLKSETGSGKTVWMKSDLDIAWVRDTNTGRYLTQNEVLYRVAKPLNQRFLAAGNPPAFMHGAHFTALETFLDTGPAGAAMGKYAKIGAPGPVSVFGGSGGGRTLRAAEVRAFALEEGLPWAKAWDPSGGLTLDLGALLREYGPGAHPHLEQSVTEMLRGKEERR